MSYEIEYRYAAFHFDGQQAYKAFEELSMEQGQEKHFFGSYSPTRCLVQFVESGSNNTYEMDSDRRARSWQLQHVGQEGDCMQRVIRASEYVESGMTQPFGRCQKAENYIVANRKRLAEAMPLDLLFKRISGCTLQFSIHSFDASRAEGHPWWKKAIEAGWVYTPAYHSQPSGIRMTVVDRLQLECALLCLTDVGNGICGTMASFGQSQTLPSALAGISGSEQRSLFAA